MKVKVKKTGEVYLLADWAKVPVDNHDSFGNVLEFPFEEVEILQDKTDDIDWEQRRYEIAKDLFVRYSVQTATEAVDGAERLIKELKRRNQSC